MDEEKHTSLTNNRNRALGFGRHAFNVAGTEHNMAGSFRFFFPRY